MSSSKLLLSAALLSLSLGALAQPGFAGTAVVSDPLEKMVKAGWAPVAPGVLQRSKGGDKVESLVTGVDGFTWKLRRLEAQMEILRTAFAANPTGDLRVAIAAQRKAIVSTKQLIARLQSGKSDVFEDKISCTINFGYDADAYPLSSAAGVGGTANANFSSNCAFSGEVYAFSYSQARTASGLMTTLTKTDGPRSGASVSASAVGSVNGVTECYSHAESSMTTSSLNPTSYTISDDNYSCPSVMNVSVTNDWGSDLYISGYDCYSVNWTTNISGGAPGYTTTMYENGYSAGNVTSLSDGFCGSNANWTQTVTVSANVTDSQGQSKSASNILTVHYSAVNSGCGGPYYPYPYRDNVQEPCVQQ